MLLEPIRVLQGLFVLIFIIITIIVGIKICLKYLERKETEYLLVGISWIGMASPWFADAVVFLVIIFNPSLTVWYINAEWYFIQTIAFMPGFIMFWLFALKKLMYGDKGIYVIIMGFISGLIFEILFFYFLFTDFSQIGTFHDVFEAEFALLCTIYIIFLLVVFLVTGIQFALRSLKHDNPEVKLRAKLLIIAFISYASGIVLEVVIAQTNVPLMIIAKLILISSSIEYYMSFALPTWTKKLFLKQE